MRKNLLKIILSFIITLTLVFVINLNHGSINAESDNSLNSFLNFEKEIIEINKQNNVKPIIIDKDEKVQSLEEITSWEILDYGTDEIVNEKILNTLTKENDSYYLTQEDGFEIYTKFALKRLIVVGEVKNNYGAIKVITGYKNISILCYATEQETKEAYEKLITDKNLIITIDQYSSISGYGNSSHSGYTYNNWGSENIDIAGYREYLKDNNVNKESVVVVMDTGINTSHEMFRNRLLTDSNGKIKGYSYFNSTYKYSYTNLSFDKDDTNKYSFEDNQGHGTHVAGIVCDLTPENVKILPIKVSLFNSTTGSTFISAYSRIIEVYSKQYNILSVNLSYSGAGKESEGDRDLFNELCYKPLKALNILPITAAGNDSIENNIEGLEAIVVSALTKQTEGVEFDSYYSNYGKIVDISAPGSNILSANIASSDKALTSGLVSKNGTSMAAPQVAGVVALLCLDPIYNTKPFTAKEIENRLYDLSLDFGEKGKDIYYGHGVVNLRYFESEKNEEITISFSNDQGIISNDEDYIEVDEKFNLKLTCSDSNFEIYYSINNFVPTATTEIKYEEGIEINKTICIYAIAYKMEGNNIVEISDIHKVSFFYFSGLIDDYLQNSGGTLISYTGHFRELEIPEYVDGIKVTKIAQTVFAYAELERLILPESCVEIDATVFYRCENLKYFFAPGLKTVGMGSFYMCKSAPFVTSDQPDESSTEGIYLPALNILNDKVFVGCSGLTFVKLDNLTTFDYASSGLIFANCISLNELILPNIKTLPMGLFYNCINLKEFTIGENVSSICVGVLSENNLEKIVVENDNKFIYSDGQGLYCGNTFYGIVKNHNENYEILNQITVNETTSNITILPEEVLLYESFNTLIIPENILSIGKFAAAESTINKLIYKAKKANPDYYDATQNGVFRPFSNVNELVVDETVEKVPMSLFYGATMSKIVIKSSKVQFENNSLVLSDSSIKKLYLDFNESVNSTWQSSLENSYLFLYTKVESIYCRSEQNFTTSSLSKFKYIGKDEDCFVYSTNGFKITATFEGAGTITPSGYVAVIKGSNKQFIFTATPGAEIEDVLIDGVSVGKQTQYTFTNITKAHTIHVKFSEVIQYYKIISIASENGEISPHGEKSVKEGTNITYTITPNEGYEIEDVLVDGSSVGAVKNYTFNNVTQNHTISATFKIKTYEIMASVSGNGEISPTGSKSLNYGASLTYTITPKEGYYIEDVLVDNVSVGAVETYTFTNVQANHTIVAIFKIQKFEIIASVNGNGTITPNGTKTVNYGDSVKYTITPNEGYEIEDVLVNEESIGAVETYTFTNIHANHRINVIFKIKTYKIILSSNGNGTISPSDVKTVNFGDSVKYTITPSEGYEIEDVLVDGESIGAVETYTFVNIQANHTISVLFASLGVKYFIKHWKETLSSENAIKFGNNYYILEEEEYSYGHLDTVTSAEQKTYFGFINQPIEQQHITENTVVNILYDRTKHQLTLISEDGISEVLGAGEYKFEQQVTISANVEDWYVWNEWESNNTLVSNSKSMEHTFIMPNEDITLTARAIRQYLITINPTENGTINPSENQIVISNSALTLTFTPNEGYEIEQVIIDEENIGKENSYTFNNILSDHTVSVKFKLKTFIITASSGKNGSISPTGETIVTYGSNKIYTVVPDEGYEVDSVKVDGENLGVIKNYEFKNIKENHEIVVMFKIKTYTITASANGYGVITPSGISTINHGEEITYSITPNEGYEIERVLVDNENIGSVTTYTFENVKSIHTISVVFKQITFVITATAGMNGTISSQGESIVVYGGNKEYTITPNDGYEIEKLLIDNNVIEAIEKYDFKNIKSNHSIYVTFKLKEYKVTVSVEGEGYINPIESIIVKHGEDIIFNKIVPSEGYILQDVLIDGISIGPVTSYSFEKISEPHSIKVKFKQKEYTIIANASANGQITFAGENILHHGEEIKFNITPNEGYRVKNIIVNGEQLQVLNSFILANVNKDYTIDVNFEPIKSKIEILYNGKGLVASNVQINEISYKDSRILTINPNKGWMLDYVLVDGKMIVVEGNTITLNDIEDDVKVEINFIKTPVVNFLSIFIPIMLITISIGLGVGVTCLAVKLKKTKKHN